MDFHEEVFNDREQAPYCFAILEFSVDDGDDVADMRVESKDGEVVARVDVDQVRALMASLPKVLAVMEANRC